MKQNHSSHPICPDHGCSCQCEGMEHEKTKKKIRRMIEIFCEDGVMPPYGFMVTPDEYDYLEEHHPLMKKPIEQGEQKKECTFQGITKINPRDTTTVSTPVQGIRPKSAKSGLIDKKQSKVGQTIFSILFEKYLEYDDAKRATDELKQALLGMESLKDEDCPDHDTHKIDEALLHAYETGYNKAIELIRNRLTKEFGG